jgi:uncharacterized integral membrane protein
MQYVQASLAILIISVLAIFSIQNLDSVNLSLFFWSISMPKIVLILALYALGMFSGWGFVQLAKRMF